jgi:hypothetical protein
LSFPVVRFQGPKEGWAGASVRSYNFGEAIGVMNYFNASPGVEPAGLLLLDDVHLLEQPLRDMYTVAIPQSDPLYLEILRRIVVVCPYYTLADDLLNGVAPPVPPEMVVFPGRWGAATEARTIGLSTSCSIRSSWLDSVSAVHSMHCQTMSALTSFRRSAGATKA